LTVAVLPKTELCTSVNRGLHGKLLVLETLLTLNHVAHRLQLLSLKMSRATQVMPPVPGGAIGQIGF
jgi:hypothetical protein